MSDEKMSFTSHLEELRRRLIICACAIAGGFALSYAFSEQIFLLLVRPLTSELPPDSQLIFTELPEAFLVYLKLSFFAGIVVASPVILWEIWCFVAPGLYDHEKKYVFPFVIISTLLFVAGVIFCYLIVFPFAFKFFMGYRSEIIKPLPSIKEFLSFACKMLLAFGVIFELPVFVVFLSKLGIVNAGMLQRQRKFAIVGIFVVAAIMTPPDALSQILMAIPLLGLYEISILAAKMFGRKTEAEKEEDND